MTPLSPQDIDAQRDYLAKRHQRPRDEWCGCCGRRTTDLLCPDCARHQRDWGEWVSWNSGPMWGRTWYAHMDGMPCPYQDVR